MITASALATLTATPTITASGDAYTDTITQITDHAPMTGVHLASCLSSMGVSRADFATLLGVTPDTVDAWVTGAAPLTDALVERVVHQIAVLFMYQQDTIDAMVAEATATGVLPVYTTLDAFRAERPLAAWWCTPAWWNAVLSRVGGWVPLAVPELRD